MLIIIDYLLGYGRNGGMEEMRQFNYFYNDEELFIET